MPFRYLPFRSLKLQSGRKLESPRSAGTEHLAGERARLPIIQLVEDVFHDLSPSCQLQVLGNEAIPIGTPLRQRNRLMIWLNGIPENPRPARTW